MNRQGRRRGVVKSEWSIDQGSYLMEAYLCDHDRSNCERPDLGWSTAMRPE